MKIYNPLTTQSFKPSAPLDILCESYTIREQLDEKTGKVNAVFLEGVAITFDKPTRNRVSYTNKSGLAKRQTLNKKPFLDTHHDDSIRTHPPYGHVESCEQGTNPKNGLPCLMYRVNIDPAEEVFIRKAKRGDIAGCSIQVLVNSVEEKEDEFGTYIEAEIREYLELSAVLIPGDGDTSLSFAESFHKFKNNLSTSSGEGIISPDGVLPRQKVLAKEQGDDEEDETDAEAPLMPLPKEQKHFDPSYGQSPDQDDIDDIEVDKPVKYIGKRETTVAGKGILCPVCSSQFLCDNYSNGFQLRCSRCNYKINNFMEDKKMSVIQRKEFGNFGNDRKPSNEAPVAPQPQMPAQQPMGQQPMAPEPQQVSPHSHSEIDQLLVKVQELESTLQNMQMGGISEANQESLDSGKPEDDEGKPTGEAKPVKDNQGNWDIGDAKKVESIVARISKKVVEELKGEPERNIGKQLDKSGPENTSNVPQSKQPAVGDAPSGGGFDSDDKTNKEDGDESVKKATKPASEYDKLPIKKNKLDRAKALIERAKKLMKEANEPDPSQPQPGETADKPVNMDGAVPNKSPVGGTEETVEGEGDKFPKMREQDDEGEDEEDIVDKVFETLKKEIKSDRRSMVGMSALSNAQTELNHEEFISNKEKVSQSVKEYLRKAGHGRALGFMA